MPRTTTAEQIKQSRKSRRFILIVLALLICGTGYFLFQKERKEEPQREIPILAAYDRPVEAEADWMSGKTVSLFGADLCAVSEDVGQDPAVTAEAGITFDMTSGEVCYSKNAHERLEPASVTKVMTCLVALKYGDLSKEITIEDDMLANLDPDSSLCHITPGGVLTLEQLLYGLMIPSGNDAANAIAYCVAGGEAEFVDLMNREAVSLGAAGTHYTNAHGLTNPEHYTTAYDIYLIYHEAMKYEKFREIIGTQRYTADFMYNGAPGSLTWERGIWYFNGQAEAPAWVTPLGGKTGTTPEAGYCLSLVSQDKEGNQYISVVLKAESRESLYTNMTALLSKIPN